MVFFHHVVTQKTPMFTSQRQRGPLSWNDIICSWHIQSISHIFMYSYIVCMYIYIYSIHVYHCRIYINKWFACPFDLMFFPTSSLMKTTPFTGSGSGAWCGWRWHCHWIPSMRMGNLWHPLSASVAPSAGGAKGESRILAVNVWLWNRLEFTKGNIKVFYSIL
jgi:hypothetical protein